MNVHPLRPTDSSPECTTCKGEALAYRAMRLCISTMWKQDVKDKAGLTPDKMRAELARILFEVQKLKRKSLKGEYFATLELAALLSTLDMFENGMFRKDILGVDNG